MFNQIKFYSLLIEGIFSTHIENGRLKMVVQTASIQVER